MHRTIGDSYGTISGKNIFRKEDSGGSYEATQFTYDSANAWQEEIANVIESEGLTLNSDSETVSEMIQLNNAINKKVNDKGDLLQASITNNTNDVNFLKLLMQGANIQGFEFQTFPYPEKTEADIIRLYPGFSISDGDLIITPYQSASWPENNEKYINYDGNDWEEYGTTQKRGVCQETYNYINSNGFNPLNYLWYIFVFKRNNNVVDWGFDINKDGQYLLSDTTVDIINENNIVNVGCLFPKSLSSNKVYVKPCWSTSDGNLIFKYPNKIGRETDIDGNDSIPATSLFLPENINIANISIISPTTADSKISIYSDLLGNYNIDEWHGVNYNGSEGIWGSNLQIVNKGLIKVRSIPGNVSYHIINRGFKSFRNQKFNPSYIS